MGERGAWLLVTTSEAFEAARAQGLEVAGLPAASETEAARPKTGDAVAVLLSDVPGFAATGEVTGDPRGERISARITAACAAGDYEPAAPLVPHLRLAKEEWSGAHPGQVLPLPLEDADLLRISCRARERGRPRPPGAPPTEMERPPRIPPKLKKREE